jgi:hypothetical protein
MHYLGRLEIDALLERGSWILNPEYTHPGHIKKRGSSKEREDARLR